MSKIANDVKKLLNGSLDEKLEIIERRTKDRLQNILNVTELPKSFDSVVYEVTLKRFNRIGQEGMQSYSQEGLSMAFPDSDFSEYQDEIEEYKNKEIEELYKPKRGRFTKNLQNRIMIQIQVNGLKKNPLEKLLMSMQLTLVQIVLLLFSEALKKGLRSLGHSPFLLFQNLITLSLRVKLGKLLQVEFLH